MNMTLFKKSVCHNHAYIHNCLLKFQNELFTLCIWNLFLFLYLISFLLRSKSLFFPIVVRFILCIIWVSAVSCMTYLSYSYPACRCSRLRTSTLSDTRTKISKSWMIIKFLEWVLPLSVPLYTHFQSVIILLQKRKNINLNVPIFE